MPNFPNDKIALRDEIKNHFAAARHEEGIKLLLDFTQNHCPNFQNDAVLISSAYYSLKKEIVDPKDATLRNKQIINSALQVLDDAWKTLGEKTLKNYLEYLQQRADTIKKAIEKHPERGTDLLIEFANKYAGDLAVEDKVILKKLDLLAEEDLAKKQAIVAELLSIVDKIVADYDPEKVKESLEKEQALASATAQLRPRNDLVLVAENLKKSYADSKFTLQAGRLELRLGEITGLVGENATGKTTLFRILAGDLAPDNGSVQYPLFNPKQRLHWPDLKNKIAYVPQELPQWQGPLLENIRYEAARHGLLGEANQEATEYIIQRLGLAPYLDKTWAELSGGYKLRFALARALVWKAQLVIVDEPLAFLDIKTQLVVLNDLKNLAKSFRYPIAILISSQHLHEIEAVADQMLFMKEGELEQLGRTADLGSDREQNVFELKCPLPFAEFSKQLEGFDYQKTWSNGMYYFVTAPLHITGQDLLLWLREREVLVNYYRDISRSVKTRFYAENI